MGSTPRMTGTALAVLAAFLDDPAEELSGLQVCAGAGLRAGSVHAVLARLEGIGWVESRWEDPDTASDRPPRRYYRLTGVGATLARSALDYARRPAPRLRWRPVTGRP